MSRKNVQQQPATSAGGEIPGSAIPAAPSAPHAGARCAARRANGRPCRSVVVLDSGFCPMHDPKNQDAAKAWRQRGRIGQQKAHRGVFPPVDFSSEENVRRALELAADAVLLGRLPNSSAKALAALAHAGMKATELGIASRLASLERAVRERTK